MYCKFCGKEIDADSVYCSYCGMKLPAILKPNLNFGETEPIKKTQKKWSHELPQKITAALLLISFIAFIISALIWKETDKEEDWAINVSFISVGIFFLLAIIIRMKKWHK